MELGAFQKANLEWAVAQERVAAAAYQMTTHDGYAHEVGNLSPRRENKARLVCKPNHHRQFQNARFTIAFARHLLI